MSSPIILIPRQFKGVTVSKLANDITSQHPNELPGALTFDFCQSALDWDPLSASKRDPFERRVRAVALAPSELAGIAETVRARVV
jgi:hypothetical protein